MSSITAQLRLMGLSSTTYQEKQTLSLEEAIQELDLLSTTVSTENYTEEGLLDTIWNGIKAFFKAIADFFMGLFGKSKEKEVDRILVEAKKELDGLEDAVKDTKAERVSTETERLVKDTDSALSVSGVKIQDIPTNNLEDFDKFMLAQPDRSHTRDQSLSAEESVKKTREALSVITQNAAAPVRSAEEKAGKAVLNKVAQTLPNDATPAEVASVATKTLAVTEAKMKLVLQDQGRCNLPGIDYEGSKLHIALANFQILSQYFIDTLTASVEIEAVLNDIQGKDYGALSDRNINNGGIFPPGKVPLISWHADDKKYYFSESSADLNVAGHVRDVITRRVLAANDYAGIVANVSKNNDTKSVGNLIKSIQEEITQSSKSIKFFSKVAEKVAKATAVVDKIDPKTASKEEAEAVRNAGMCLREIGRLCAVSEQLQRTALANALQAVRILRRKVGQMKEYNGLLKKLNEEVAKVKSRK